MHTRSDDPPLRAAVMAKCGEVITFDKTPPARLLCYVPDPSAARALARRWAGMHCATLADVQADLERAAQHVRAHERVSRGCDGVTSEALRTAEARTASLRERLGLPDVAEIEKSLLGRPIGRISRRIRDIHTALWGSKRGQRKGKDTSELGGLGNGRL